MTFTQKNQPQQTCSEIVEINDNTYRPDGWKSLTSIELENLAHHFQEEARQTQQALHQERQANQSKLDQIVINLLRSGMDSEQIADITGYSIEQVEALR